MNVIRMILTQVFVLYLLASYSTVAHAACGASHQRMQVGVLPDIFLNHQSSITPLKKGINATFARGVMPSNPFAEWSKWKQETEVVFSTLSPTLETEKTFNHYWTANLDIPGVGDCNVLAKVTLPKVSIADTYGPCFDDLRLCPLKRYPSAATVGPAISEFTVKEWPIRIVADPSLTDNQIGAVLLFGLDCSGDICIPPPCLREDPNDEFFERPNPECGRFDPTKAGWQSNDFGVGAAYLLGRGNLYIGPRQQPAFAVKAISDTDAIEIDHWIANDNPKAVILVTPKGVHNGSTRYFGVQYDQRKRRWSIVAERADAIIPANSMFNVYVMGNKGPGFQHWALNGLDRIWIDDPLVNGNPNALIFATHVISESCQQTIDSRGIVDLTDLNSRSQQDSEWHCTSGHFDHPLGVEYDSGRQRWAIVSEDGTRFGSPVGFNVFVSGLAGTYRAVTWHPEMIPPYAGRLEAAFDTPTGNLLPLRDLNLTDQNEIVFIMHNTTPYNDRDFPKVNNLHPTGMMFQYEGWHVANLDDEEMPHTSFNVLAPLPAP